MIKSFADKATAAVFHGLLAKKWSVTLQTQARHRLMALDKAIALSDLSAMPSNRLEKLKGKRQGQWSIRVNRQWRIGFTWQDGHATNVVLVDYH